MEKEILAQVILDFQKFKFPKIIERDLIVETDLPIKRAIVILGPRRAGKTYYLYSLIKKIMKKGIERERILYVNFEDPKLINLKLQDALLLIETFYEIYPKNKKVYLFLMKFRM